MTKHNINENQIELDDRPKWTQFDVFLASRRLVLHPVEMSVSLMTLFSPSALCQDHVIIIGWIDGVRVVAH